MDKYNLQEKYCILKKFPLYAPKIRCFSCGKNIWDKISLDDATNKHIISCPNCNRSFC